MANFSKADTVRRNMYNNYSIINSDNSPEAAAKFHTAYTEYQKALKSNQFKISKKVTAHELKQLKKFDDDIITIQNKLLDKYPAPESVIRTVIALNKPKPATPVKPDVAAAKPSVAAAPPQNSSFNLNLLIACAAVSTATLALGIAAFLLAMQTTGVVLTALGVAGAGFSAYQFFAKPSVANKDETLKGTPAAAAAPAMP